VSPGDPPAVRPRRLLPASSPPPSAPIPAAVCANRLRSAALPASSPPTGVPRRYGLVAYGSSLDSVGMLARTAEDVALLFSLYAGHDPLDATTMDVALPKISLTAAKTCTACASASPKSISSRAVQAEVEAAVRAAIEQLKALGAEIKKVSLPHTDYALPVYYLIAPAEASANLARYDGVRYGLRMLPIRSWICTAIHAALVLAPRSNAASCLAHTPSLPVITTPITASPKSAHSDQAGFRGSFRRSGYGRRARGAYHSLSHR